MKKLLLSMALLAGLSASAATYTISSVATSDFTENDDKSEMTGSFTADGKTFEVTIGKGTNKSNALADSKSTDMIKVYKGYTISITAPADVNIRRIEFTTSAAKYNLPFAVDAPATCTADDGKIIYINASGNNTFTGAANEGQVRITAFSISDEAGDAPVIETTIVKKVEAIADGKYAFYFTEGYAQMIAGSNAFGYPMLKACTLSAEGTFEIEDANLFTITSTDKGYTIQDSKDRFYGMDATHFGSFNLYNSADADGSNCYWTVEFVDGAAKISNTGRDGAYIAMKKYNNDYEMVTTDNADQTLPQLFAPLTDAVAEIEAIDTDAPVEYYNLQGVRVSDPANGLYIRRQGNKVTKILVK